MGLLAVLAAAAVALASYSAQTQASSVTLKVERAGGAAVAAWTSYSGSDFSHYQLVACEESNFHGSYCSATIYKSGAIWRQDASALTVPGISADKGYGFILQVWRKAGAGALKFHATLAAPTPPKKPSPTPTPGPAPTLTATRAADGASATLTWTAYTGSGFKYYQAVVCEDRHYDGASCSGTPWKSGAIYGQDSTGPLTVPNLDASTGYGVILQTWRASGALKSHATLPGDGPSIDAPSNLTVTPGDGYYDLAWDAVEGATGYDIRAKVANSSSWTSVATGVTGTSYRYTTSDVVYAVAVSATNADGASAWAEVSRLPSSDWLNVVIQGGVSAASAQAQSQLAAPASITVTRDNNLRDEKLRVSWAAVSGAGGYNLACAARPPSNTAFSSLSWWHCGSVDSGSTTSFIVDEGKTSGVDLVRSRSYTVAVRAVTTDPAQASPWLLSTYARPTFVPTDISVSRAAGSVSLSWTQTLFGQGYEIECATFENNVTGTYTLCADVETATVTNGTINVTISAWTAGGADYTIDDTKTYDLSVRTTNAWGNSPWTWAPLIYPDPTLTVSNVGVTTATLTIADHSGNWYYKHTNTGATCDGPVTANTSTKDLTGLTAGTAYTFSAYSDSTCTTANRLATASRFTTLSSVSNLTNAVAGDSDISRESAKAIAFTTGSNTSGYILKSLTAKLKQKGSPIGDLTVKLYPMQGSGPYTKDSAPSSTVLATLSGTAPTSASWTDTDYTCSGSGCRLEANTTYFIVADNDNGSTGSANAWSWAYTTSGSETKTPATNGWDLQYAHSYVGGGSWQSYEDWHVAELVFANAPSLTASNLTLTTATLTIANHAGVWYYKHTNAGATCDGPVAAGTSAKALTLTAGTSYTYSAYSDSTCTSANLLATAASFTTLASVSNLASAKSGNSRIFNTLWQAVAFTTGPNSGGYVLKSVTLPMKNSGSSSGLTLTLRQMEGSGPYSATSVPTATDLVTLTGTAPTGSAWTDTTFTCSGSGCDLSANTTYFVIAGTTNLSADQFGWAWAAVETETATPTGTGWSVGFSHYLSTSYTGWQSHSDWNIAEIVFGTK